MIWFQDFPNTNLPVGHLSNLIQHRFFFHGWSNLAVTPAGIQRTKKDPETVHRFMESSKAWGLTTSKKGRNEIFQLVKNRLNKKKQWFLKNQVRLHQDCIQLFSLLLFFKTSLGSQFEAGKANNITGAPPEHGWKSPRHFRTAAWKPNVVFCFSETSSWLTQKFRHSPDTFFTKPFGYVLPSRSLT